MGTGLFVQRHTDFHFNEAFPTEIVRMYRPQDRQSRAFGIGTSHSFDIFLVGDAEHFSFIDLILADGARIHYRRVSPGTGFADAIFVSDDQFDNVFSGSRIQWNGHGWEILRQDGWTFVFPASTGARRSQQAALTGIHDASGHAFGLDRNSQGDLLSLTTPEGTSVRFDYDSKARVVRTEDNHGRHLKYEYDDSGRLVQVQDSEGYAERYTYDEQDLMLSVSVNGRLVLINEYDSSGHLTGQTLSDGRKLAYRYTAIDGKPKGTVLIDPRGYLTRLRYGPGGEVVRLMPEVPGSQ
jgi:YD repeat-containing protein